MKFKMKLGSPLFLLTLFVVLACSLGSVSAANDIHDVTIDDTNTEIVHPEANIQDSTIYNKIINTDGADIFEATSDDIQIIRPTITDSRIYNKIVSSNKFSVAQGYDYVWSGVDASSIQNSMINNVINDVVSTYMSPSQINQGYWGSTVQNSMLNNALKKINGRCHINQGVGEGNVENSMLNNAVSDFTGVSYILQGDTGIVKDSMINNAVISSSGESIIRQGFCGNIQNSCLNNWVYGSEGKYSITQNNISNSLISNATLFSDNTTITQTNLSGVNGCLIALGCTNYTKTIDNLVDTNFFNLVIGNHVIFDLKW